MSDLDRGVTISWFARAVGASRETVRARIARAGVVPVALRLGHPVYSAGDLCRAFVAADPLSADPDALDPFKRKAHYQAELDKLRIERERGELIPRIEVEETLAHALKLLGHELETIPDILERDTGATAQQLVKIEAIVDAVREQIYERLSTARKDEAGAA